MCASPWGQGLSFDLAGLTGPGISARGPGTPPPVGARVRGCGHGPRGTPTPTARRARTSAGLPRFAAQRHVAAHDRGIGKTQRRRPVGPVRTHGGSRRPWQQFHPYAGLLGELAGCGGARRLARFDLPPGGTQPRHRCFTSRTWSKAWSVTQTSAASGSPGWCCARSSHARASSSSRAASPTSATSASRISASVSPWITRTPYADRASGRCPGSRDRSQLPTAQASSEASRAGGTAGARAGTYASATGCARHLDRSCPLPSAGGTG